MELSWIQKHILFVLIRQEYARPKELAPEGVELNLFSYHLKALIQEGFIAKHQRGVYTLTALGEKYVGSLSTTTRKTTDNIKTVIMLWAERAGQPLLFRWSRQPYLGKATLPYDRMVVGTSLHDGIKNALNEKLGLSAAKVSYCTSALICIKKDQEIISHMNALVYRVDAEDIEDGHEALNGITVWATPDTRQIMEGVVEFVDALKEGTQPIEATWQYHA